MRNLAFFIAVPVTAAIIGGAYWLNRSGKLSSFEMQSLTEPPTKEHPIARPIPTAIAQPLPDVNVRELPGVARANQRVQLAFSVPGLLTELHAAEGSTVSKGEVIARLDPRDYQNALDVAQAKFDDVKQRFDRTRNLHDHNVVPAAEYDRVKAELDMAAAELRIRAKALEDTVLSAPFDGVIATRYVENYEHIEAKKPIVSIQDIAVVEIVVQVPERLIACGGTKSLQNISVRLDAYEGRVLYADVREFSTQADPITRTYEVVLGMRPPTGIRVFTGMTATVRVEVPRFRSKGESTHARALVPSEAVVQDPDGRCYVWLIDEEAGRPQKIRVEVGEPREEGIEICSGLHPGRRVAIAGVHTLDETMIVRPMIEGREGLDG